MPLPARSRGFTLLELMVVIAVMIILMAVATPTLLRSIRIYRLENITRQVATMVQRTRYEAIARNRRIDTVGTWPWWGVAPARFGIDLNNNGALEIGAPQLEPYAQAPNDVWIVNGPAPFWDATCGIPAGYTNVTWFPNWRVSFSPRGTVVEENPVGSNNWVDGRFIYVFTIWQWDQSEPWWWRWTAVAVTPAGVFVSSSSGAWGRAAAAAPMDNTDGLLKR